MNEKFLEVLADHIVKMMKRALDARVGPLEMRLASLEAKPHVKFCGIWQSGTTYEPGDAATYAGGLWICKVATPGEPSKDFVGWQLVSCLRKNLVHRWRHWYAARHAIPTA